MCRIFFLNLDKDKDRAEFMSGQLKKLGLQFERFSAYDGRVYIPSVDEYDPILARKEGGHELLPGEIGCALSHAQLIKTIVADKIPFTLILEDDVVLPSNFNLVLTKEIEKNLSGNKWDYLLFDYSPSGLVYVRSWIRSILHNLSANKEKRIISLIIKILKSFVIFWYILPLSLFEYLRNKIRVYIPGPVIFFRPVYFAGAYLITYEGAKKLHNLSVPVRYTADHLPNRARLLSGLKFRCYAPLVVRQQREVFGSSILNLSAEEVRKILS